MIADYGYGNGRPVTLKFSIPSPAFQNPLVGSSVAATLGIPSLSGRSASAPATSELEWPIRSSIQIHTLNAYGSSGGT
ncbi:unnamed protein product [Allacma fusca]|uniref:Uncharacterized protein n=1 Tax=Allacma fusca TaxID=39272 RepID=A0A8J2PN20_9HEXA|nr:unnamed protein product [Allacma fusca]